MNTDDLIRTLAANAIPVRPLRHPMVRAAIWLAVSGAYVAVVVAAYRLFGNSISLAGDWRFVVEQLAMIATALMAAVAAFCCIVPGRSRLIALVPIIPLSIWLASMGETCRKLWDLLVSGSITLEGGWDCLPPLMLTGLGPAVLMLAMLKQGAPLYPRSTLMLAALAAAALGNLGLRFFHEGDVTVLLLMWQVGATAALIGLAGLVGARLFAWRLTRVGRPIPA